MRVQWSGHQLQLGEPGLPHTCALASAISDFYTVHAQQDCIRAFVDIFCSLRDAVFLVLQCVRCISSDAVCLSAHSCPSSLGDTPV